MDILSDIPYYRTTYRTRHQATHHRKINSRLEAFGKPSSQRGRERGGDTRVMEVSNYHGGYSNSWMVSHGKSRKSYAYIYIYLYMWMIQVYLYFRLSALLAGNRTARKLQNFSQKVKKFSTFRIFRFFRLFKQKSPGMWTYRLFEFFEFFELFDFSTFRIFRTFRLFEFFDFSTFRIFRIFRLFEQKSPGMWTFQLFGWNFSTTVGVFSEKLRLNHPNNTPNWVRKGSCLIIYPPPEGKRGPGFVDRENA